MTEKQECKPTHDKLGHKYCRIHKNEKIAYCSGCITEKINETLEEAIWRKINWMQLLSKAIGNRPRSWKNGKEAVVEWRNASDEIRSALITELERLGILENPFEKARKEMSKND